MPSLRWFIRYVRKGSAIDLRASSTHEYGGGQGGSHGVRHTWDRVLCLLNWQFNTMRLPKTSDTSAVGAERFLCPDVLHQPSVIGMWRRAGSTASLLMTYTSVGAQHPLPTWISGRWCFEFFVPVFSCVEVSVIDTSSFHAASAPSRQREVRAFLPPSFSSGWFHWPRPGPDLYFSFPHCKNILHLSQMKVSQEMCEVTNPHTRN